MVGSDTPELETDPSPNDQDPVPHSPDLGWVRGVNYGFDPTPPWWERLCSPWRRYPEVEAFLNAGGMEPED